MNSSQQGLQAVDLIKIQRELDDLELFLRSVPPDGNEIDSRIANQYRRIRLLLPLDLDLADCSYRHREALKDLKSATDVLMTLDELQEFRKRLAPATTTVQERTTSPLKATKHRAAAKKKRPGLKPPTHETARVEKLLYDAWKRAHEFGTSKTDFAKDRETTVKSLDAVLDRVRKRIHRADK